MVDAERLDITGAFNTENLRYITCISKDTSDSRLFIWSIHKYKEVMEFIKKFRVRDMDIIPP